MTFKDKLESVRPYTYTPVVDTNQTRECLFVEGPDAGCDGVCFSEASLDECGECVEQQPYCNYVVSNGDAELDECGV